MSAREIQPHVTPTPRDAEMAVGGGDDEISLLSGVNAVLRNRVTVLGVAALCALLVVVASAVRARTYSSSATFMPQSRGAQSGLTGLAAQFGVSVAGADPGQTPQFYVDLIQSRQILRDAVDTRYTFPTDSGRVSATLTELYGASESQPALRREVALAELRDRVGAKVSPGTGVVALTVTTTNPALSEQVATRIVDLLNRFNLERRQSQAAAERRFAGERLNAVRADLRTAENRLQTFLQENRAFGAAPALRFEQERLARDVSLQQQLFNTLAQSYEQAKLDEVRDTPVITLIERPEVPVRPDPRGLAGKAVLGLLGGLVLGVIVALAHDFMRYARRSGSEEFAEFSALRRAAMDDLTHPWRPVARLFRHRSTAA